MLNLLLTLVMGVSLDPTQIVQELDNEYARLWNAGDYETIANHMFDEDALVIPPIPTEFIARSDLVRYFQYMHEYWGDNMTMTPEVVTMEEEFGWFVIHEIGRWNGVYNRYYLRWVNDNGSWLITLAAIAIGEPEPGASNPPSSSFITTIPGNTPTQIIAKLEKQFDYLYNKQDFAGVTDLFDEDALLIPRSADRFLNKSELTEYWQMAYSIAGLKHANTKPVIIIEESPLVIHEMGGIQVNNETQFLPYYVRWVRNCTAWNMKFYLSVFPIPHPHPPEIRLL